LEEERLIRGPLGIWPWPILNAIARFLLFLRKVRMRHSKVTPRPTMANIEKWTWTDYKGRKRTLIIERQLKEY